MERLEIKTAEFEIEPEMRCSGMCKGSCSCPTGHCRCKNNTEIYLSNLEGKDEIASSDSYQFRQAA